MVAAANCGAIGVRVVSCAMLLMRMISDIQLIEREHGATPAAARTQKREPVSSSCIAEYTGMRKLKLLRSFTPYSVRALNLMPSWLAPRFVLITMTPFAAVAP